MDLNINTPIRIYEITAGTIAIEKVKLAPLSNEEVELLSKLLQIKFEERTPEKVKELFSKQEIEKLDSLIRKHLVTIYYGGKYVKTGVYHVPNLVYRQVLEKTRSEKNLQKREQTPVIEKFSANEEEKAVQKEKIEAKETKEAKEKKVKEKNQEEEIEEDPIKILNKQGYIVLQSEGDAKKISELISNKRERSQVTGIRGFDKKFYLVKNSFVLRYQSKIKSVLKSGPKSAEKIAEALDMPEEAAVALLTVLREEGELLEKRKGIFALMD